MGRFRLPVSGLDVLFRQTTGAEDIMLVEETSLDIHIALALADALARLPNGEPVPWTSVPVADLDAALLAMRRCFIGEQVNTSVVCANVRPTALPSVGRHVTVPAASGCPARIDIAFRIGDYLAHHAPSVPREISPADDPGWFRLNGTDVAGRVVSCADQMAIEGRPDRELELVRRCVRPATTPTRLRRKLESAMAKLAPSLYDELDGSCPECGATVRIVFDPLRYVLAELRERARFVYQEVHLIAARYRWSEAEILALPRSRRARYAEFAHEGGAGG
jgi:hypothetical protein